MEDALFIFAWLFGIAIILHGPSVITIHKHYHGKDTQKTECPHGHGNWDNCPDCGH